MPSSCHPPVTVSQMIPRDDDVENCGRTTISRRGKGGRKPLSSPPNKRGRRICFEEAPPESPPPFSLPFKLGKGRKRRLENEVEEGSFPHPPFSPNEESCNFSLSSSIPSSSTPSLFSLRKMGLLRLCPPLHFFSLAGSRRLLSSNAKPEEEGRNSFSGQDFSPFSVHFFPPLFTCGEAVRS